MDYFDIPADSSQPIKHRKGETPQEWDQCIEDGELTWFHQGSGRVNQRLVLLSTRLGANVRMYGNGAVHFVPGTRDEGHLLWAMARWLGFSH